MQYCQKCGKPNELDAVFCNKCGNPFKAIAQAAPAKPIVVARKIVVEGEEDELPVRSRPERRRASIPQAPMNGATDISLQTARSIQDDEDETELDDEHQEEDTKAIALGQDAPSLQYVPKVERLEIEALETDTVQGVKFGTLVQQAQMDLAAQQRAKS